MIMFIFAHPDDEAYGPAGTIKKLTSEGKEVVVVSMCRGNRPGNEEVAGGRVEAFEQSVTHLGAKPIRFDYSDCRLEYAETLKRIEELIAEYKPEVVFTHNASDLHRDHRLVAECVLVATRPKPSSPVKKLYFCELPSSTDWSFGQMGERFKPNTYFDISQQIYDKQKVMNMYSTEVYDYPDARSVEAMEVLAMHRGKQIGCHRAEAFKLIFSRSHKIC
jgi:LmbE family N-acetylglucosaminyl deacetylase